MDWIFHMPEQPPYLRIADLLRQRIVSGEWAVGGKLPSRARYAFLSDGKPAQVSASWEPYDVRAGPS
jgi:DNA-binding transcriptional regulator YhcF (GntR family)